MEIFSFTASRGPEFYLSVWSDWHEYEVSAFLFVVTPTVHAYHSREESAEGQAKVQAVAVTEFCVINILSFVHTSIRGTMFRESSDPRLQNKTGLIMPFGRRMREFVDAAGFTTILEGC